MASRFYGIDLGGNKPTDVTEGAATGSKGVEIQVDLTKVTRRTDILLLVEALQHYLITRETDPAS